MNHDGASTAEAATYPSSPQRVADPVADKILILGLDGATFTSLHPMMDEGRMPRLKAAFDGGASGTLYSTVPPITPAAWTTFLTGRQPGEHRILDFEGYDAFTGRLRLNNTQSSQHVRNIWQILSAEGFKVGSVNVPMTYPPVAVNGFNITGFETPGPQSEFAYPPDLKQQILERWPDPTLKAKWRRKAGGGIGLFAENLDYLGNSFHQGAAMTTWLGARFGWDALMVVFKLVDNLQHKTWKYLDPRWSDRDPKRRDLVKKCFEELDKAVGVLLDYAESEGAVVIMVSDHGHGSLEGKVFPNRFLQQWGYLKLHGTGTRLAAAARRTFDKTFGPKHQVATLYDIDRHVPIDLSRTTACVMHAGNAGFLYLNLKGRQPTGMVEPADYERLRDELIARFTGPECRVTAPWGEQIDLFPEVYKPEELYNCSRESEPWLPDILMIQHETLAVVRRLNASVVDWLPYSRIEGTHRKEGILIATGPGVARRRKITASLLDCAPTVLAALGTRVPQNMPGRVITELFERAPMVERQRDADDITPEPAGRRQHTYTRAELDEVTARLSDLGYLE
jgi:predicted AlkP superfamily phosphohydrolase/phosphomutase